MFFLSILLTLSIISLCEGFTTVQPRTSSSIVDRYTFKTNKGKYEKKSQCLYMVASSPNNLKDEDDIFLNMKSSGSILMESGFGAESVPDGQVPANEYLDLVRAPLFGWAAQDKGVSGLAVRLGIVYAVFLALAYPVAGATFTEDGFLMQKLACANVASLLVLLMVLVRLYSGWGYIGSRLQSNFIEYEETGWYDGAVVKKSDKEKARDLFLYRSDVQPAENRIKLFAGIISAVWIASCVGLNVTLKNKPVFNEYNPALLERLVFDDKAANVAAQESYGRPTYCNSRYYRAVANGGQGCN